MNLLCFIISVFFLGISIIFIKKRSLDFKCAMLWIFISISLIILSTNAGILEYLAGAAGIMYAPAFLFLIGIVFSLIMIFYLMIVISSMQRKITKLIQKYSILKDKIEEGEKS